MKKDMKIITFSELREMSTDGYSSFTGYVIGTEGLGAYFLKKGRIDSHCSWVDIYNKLKGTPYEELILSHILANK